MENVTTAIQLDKYEPKKDGTCRVQIRVTINRLVKYLPVGISIDPKLWNNQTQEIKEPKNLIQAERILIRKQNIQILEKHTLVKTIITDIRKRNKPVTFPVVKEIYKRGGDRTFITYAKAKISEKYNNQEIKKYTRDLNLQKLDQLNRYHPDLKFYEITKEFLVEHKAYMLMDKTGIEKPPYKKCTINTIRGHHALINEYMSLAKKEGILDYNPFELDYKIQRQEGKREHLTVDELQTVLEYWESGKLAKMRSQRLGNKGGVRVYDIGKKYHETIQHFLIGCFTGLRYSDIKTLERKHILESEYEIEKEMKKGRINRQKIVRIPITPEIETVLNLSDKDNPLYQGKLRCDSEINNILRDALEIIGIAENKHITFHASRRTFCVTALAFNMPVETVQQVMGHETIATTMIYAHIASPKRKKDMQNAWGKFKKKNANNTNPSHLKVA